MKTLVIAAMFLALVACGKKTDDPSPTNPSNSYNESPQNNAGIALSSLKNLPTLSAAIAATRLKMEERNDGMPSMGAVQLAIWGHDKMRWTDIQALPATKWAVVKKDPEVVRGQRICTSGSIIEIQTDRSTGNPLFIGGMGDEAGNIYRFVAVGSSGDLVAESNARFCGVVTNAVSYPNSMGGIGHAIQLVGLFDLPANKKP